MNYSGAETDAQGDATTEWSIQGQGRGKDSDRSWQGLGGRHGVIHTSVEELQCGYDKPSIARLTMRLAQ